MFRLHVGQALAAHPDDAGATPPATWASGSSATRPIREREAPWETRVSDVIGAMSVLWIAMPDDPGPDSLRGYIERNCIALLSNHDRDPIDPPSPGWLGHHARAPQIHSSGLWNVNHVTEHHDPRVLDELANAIAATVQTPPTSPMRPRPARPRPASRPPPKPATTLRTGRRYGAARYVPMWRRVLRTAAPFLH